MRLGLGAWAQQRRRTGGNPETHRIGKRPAVHQRDEHAGEHAVAGPDAAQRRHAHRREAPEPLFRRERPLNEIEDRVSEVAALGAAGLAIKRVLPAHDEDVGG